MPAIEHSATLTSTPESAPRYLGMLEVASQNLENLQTDTDPNEQLRAAVKLTFAAELLPVVAKTEDQQQTVTELFSDLVMFAANPDASSSLLVRSEALEAGLQILAHNQSREGAAYIPELEVYRKRFETLIPTYFTNSVVDETTYSTVHPGPYRNQVGWMTNDFCATKISTKPRYSVIHIKTVGILIRT